MLRLNILCNLFVGGKYVSINCKNIFATFFLRLTWKVGWTKWFSVFFFWCYFAANLVVCIAVLLCNPIFSVLPQNPVLIVQIFQRLKNFWISCHLIDRFASTWREDTRAKLYQIPLTYKRHLIKFGTRVFSSSWSKTVYQVTF